MPRHRPFCRSLFILAVKRKTAGLIESISPLLLLKLW